MSLAKGSVNSSSNSLIACIAASSKTYGVISVFFDFLSNKLPILAENQFLIRSIFLLAATKSGLVSNPWLKLFSTDSSNSLCLKISLTAPLIFRSKRFLIAPVFFSVAAS